MKRSLTFMLFFAFTFVFANAALAGQETRPDGETPAGTAEGGDYFVTGTGMDGSQYTGGMELIRYGGDVYTLSWSFANPMYGVGILFGNVISAAYGGPQCSLTAYVIEQGGNLTGGWANYGQTTVNSEIGTLQQATDTGSSYTLSGVNPDGAKYTGTMTITFTGDTGQVEQVIGNSNYKGVAIIQGSVLAITLGDQNCGVISYVIQEDGSLSGIWSTNGSNKTSVESAFPINIAGAHNITGANPDGSQYKGTVDVQANNQVHTFNYNIGGASLGTGIMRGNKVAVGFGGENCSVSSYFVQPDGSLAGLWTVVGQNVVGTEFATRTTPASLAEGATIPNVDGSFTIVGTNPGDTSGQTYQGTLDIIPRGSAFQLSWAFSNNSTSEGVGILLGNVLAVGFGGEGCGINAYSITPEAMEGVWGIYGSDTLGTESVIR